MDEPAIIAEMAGPIGLWNGSGIDNLRDFENAKKV